MKLPLLNKSLKYLLNLFVSTLANCLILPFKGAAILLLFLTVIYRADAQTINPYEIQKSELLKMAEEFTNQSLVQREKVLEWAEIHKVPVSMRLEDGRTLEIMYIDEHSMPVYYTTKNEGAALTTGARQLQHGGNLRINLSGKEMTVGVWDGGSILRTHQEFDQRVTIRDGGTLSDHATHVAGTIAGRGIDTKSKGMASNVSIFSFDWTGDIGEMAAEAANGLILSNHSYGYDLGWSRDNGVWIWRGHNDSIYDYRFGFYDTKSKALDELAFTAPHYLSVWSAGNDRSDAGNGSKPGDGPFDCISSEAIAKNILTVGAVQKLEIPYVSSSDVAMSSFSSWGPADDGRVKPDLVAAGVSVYSATSASNASYGAKSGTSMAAPNVTGTLTLLQELYKKINGKFMLAATLKGLAINTVKETGVSAGPDYQFGWGLLDAEKASGLIMNQDDNNYFIKELNIANGGTYEMTFKADGSGDIVAVISWTDPAGTPVNPALNPRNRMLVNDLDVRIYKQDGNEVYLPWKLDVLNPTDMATRGDNIADNIEKITIKNSEAGDYTLKVTHKGTLVNGSQNFSLILQTKNIPQRKTFFWVGDSGNWSDASNWSNVSGGTAGSVLPGENDHVVFDEKSFNTLDGNPAIVSMDGVPACFTFNWYTDKAVTIEGLDNPLFVMSSIFIIDKHKIEARNLEIVFNGNLPYNEILTNGSLENVKITFNGSGSWKIAENSRFRMIELVDGGLDVSNVIMNVKDIQLSSGYNKNFNFSGTEFHGLNSFILNESAQLNANNSIIKFQSFDGAPASTLILAGHSLAGVENQTGELRINGSGMINDIKNLDYLFISDDLEINNLESNQGYGIHFNGGVKIILRNNLILTSSALSRIKLTSDTQNPAVIESNEHKKFCFDFLDVSGVQVQGSAIFNAGKNSTIVASSGWLYKECDEIAFADFSYTFPCAGSLTHFINTSTGTLNNYFWDFYPGENSHISTDLNAFFVFPEPGKYPVKLEVSGVNETSSVTKIVEIQPNTLPLEDLTVLVSGIKYTSSGTAPKYQWFLNGKPIPNAVSRYFFNEEGKSGVYQVMIHNNVCNLISKPLLITNVDQYMSNPGGIKVFPNPASDVLQVSIDQNAITHGGIIVSLTDQMGRKVFEHEYADGTRNLSVPVNVFPVGVYFMHLKADNKVFATKVLIIR